DAARQPLDGVRIMKRYLLALGAAVAFVPALARAQSSIAVKGGLAYANTTGSGFLPGKLENRNGYSLGVAIGTAGVLGYGGEALYSKHTYESTASADARALYSIDVPVYLKLTLPIPAFAPYAYAGP